MDTPDIDPHRPYRTRYVEGYGEMEIPKHITRVERQGKNHSISGWVVRWPGFAKYFWDHHHGNDLEYSFEEAKEFLYKNYPGLSCRADPKKGIYLFYKRHYNDAEVYIEIVPVNSNKPIRLYVGMESELTPELLAKASEKAIAIRKLLIEQHCAETGHVHCVCEHVTNTRTKLRLLQSA